MTKTLNDADIVTTRRTAMKSWALKAGLAAAVAAAGVAASTAPASASDRRNQTDNDRGDAQSQTDND